MRHYNLLALPVVDDEDRLLGVITADDVLDVQVQEATEDMLRMAGVGVQERAFSPVLESARRRIPWLTFNMAWAFAGAAIIGIFNGTLDKVAALAIFMPMIAGQAGNAGIQTATIVVRAISLDEVHPNDMFALLQKEWCLGAIKGTIFGGALMLVAWVSPVQRLLRRRGRRGHVHQHVRRQHHGRRPAADAAPSGHRPGDDRGCVRHDADGPLGLHDLPGPGDAVHYTPDLM